MDSALPLIFLLAVAAAFWLLVIKPARTRQQEQLAVVRSLQPGTKVLLASGILATVDTVGDDDLRVEIAPGVVVTVVKQAVLRTADEPAPEVPEGTQEGSSSSGGTSDGG